MRDLIACLYTWLAPGLRRTAHTARTRVRGWLTTPPPPTVPPALPALPAYARGPLPRHVLARYVPIDGSRVALVRPYVLALESVRVIEELSQRERRTAAALATYGIDYDTRLALHLAIA